MKIYHHLILITAIFFSSSLLQSESKKDIDKYGFIKLKTDSTDVPFYIDGIYVGRNPLFEPIPVLPGFHLVSYLPPELTKKYMKEDLSEAYKRVYVAPKDTIDVFLFYDKYLSETDTFARQILIKNISGMSIVFLFLYLILQIS